MTEMYDRIRLDWLIRWLREPGRIIPGTAMPEFFSGKSDWQANHEIEHIVHALAAGLAVAVCTGRLGRTPAPGTGDDARRFEVMDLR